MQNSGKMLQIYNTFRVGILFCVASMFFSTNYPQVGFIFIGFGFFALPKELTEKNMYGAFALFGALLSINNFIDNSLFQIVRASAVELLVVAMLISIIRTCMRHYRIEQAQQKVGHIIFYWFIAAIIVQAFSLNIATVLSIPLSFIVIGCRVIGYLLLLNNIGLLYRITKESVQKIPPTA